MNDLITRVLRARKVLIGKDFYQFRQVKRPRITFGNRFAEWTFCPDNLDEHSVIYSFGVGEDVCFDLKLIERYQLDVHAFDPSPRSIKWVAGQNLTEKFHFHPYGLASGDGTVTFREPAEANIHSLQISDLANIGDAGSKTHLLPVHRAGTILQMLGHKAIDILKMDIEGAEYEVIEDILKSAVPVSQLLIEFHHRFANIGTGKTRKAISQLNEAGYRIFNVSASGEEISFIKVGA
ncbi:MAG: FkbM family methyltransferase [Bacteroidales bacterium]